MQACLLRHTRVKECAVVGVPDAAGLTKPHAWIVADRPSAGLGEELKAFVVEAPEPYNHPRQVVFVDALPRTHLGKVDRGKLRRGG